MLPATTHWAFSWLEHWRVLVVQYPDPLGIHRYPSRFRTLKVFITTTKRFQQIRLTTAGNCIQFDIETSEENSFSVFSLYNDLTLTYLVRTRQTSHNSYPSKTVFPSQDWIVPIFFHSISKETAIFGAAQDVLKQYGAVHCPVDRFSFICSCRPCSILRYIWCTHGC